MRRATRSTSKKNNKPATDTAVTPPTEAPRTRGAASKQKNVSVTEGEEDLSPSGSPPPSPTIPRRSKRIHFARGRPKQMTQAAHIQSQLRRRKVLAQLANAALNPSSPPQGHQEKAKRINEIIKVIMPYLDELESLVFGKKKTKPSTRASKPQIRDIVGDIEAFYIRLASNEEFCAAVLQAQSDKKNSPNAKAVFVMRDDFKDKLESSEVTEIVKRAMSLSMGGGEEEEDDDDEPETGGYVADEVIKAPQEEEEWLDEDPQAADANVTSTFEEEVVNLRSSVRELKERADLMEKDIAYLSFSTVRKKDYDRLGVREEEVLDGVALCSKVARSLEVQSFAPQWEDVLQRMSDRVIKTLDDFWNILSEESSRLLINEVEYSLISTNVMEPPGLGQRRFCIPEYVLGTLPRANAKNPTVRQGTAITIKNNRQQETRLSGSTDYFSFTLSSKESIAGLKAAQAAWTGSNQGLYKRIASTLSTQAFVIVEAKSPLARLESHIPQVVAEAVALASALSPYVPFCLTSGTEWMFGVLHQRNTTERSFWRTTPIPFRPTKGGILLMIALLVTWASTPTSELRFFRDA